MLIRSFASNHAEMEGLEALLLLMWRKYNLIVLINPSLKDHPFSVFPLDHLALCSVQLKWYVSSYYFETCAQAHKTDIW